MTNYKLVQQVQKLVENYNQTYDELLYIDWYNGSYYIGHPNIPEFKYDIGYFNQNGNQYIQVVFKTMTQLITIYKALADDFRSNDIQFYDDHKPTQPRMPPISIGGGIGEQRGKNKRMLVTLN